MLQLKLLSPLEKVLADREWYPHSQEYHNASALQGEVIDFQLAYMPTPGTEEASLEYYLKWEAPEVLREHISIRMVENVPVRLTAWHFDDNVLTRRGGLLPDLLMPWTPEQNLVAAPEQWRAVWITIRVPQTLAAGVYPITLHIQKNEDLETRVSRTLQLQVIGATLPQQEIQRTEWFHADCIAQQYHLEIWSEDFWEKLELYFRNQTSHGCTRLLTPLFTPPLDTAVGKERLTTQLVRVHETGAGKYEFDFSQLKRWMGLALACGYRNFEFAHLFSQWGAECAPKIEIDGVSRFGWAVQAQSDEYRDFLKAFIPELLAFIEANHWKDLVIFHISDEPNEKHLENYKQASALLKELLHNDYHCTDAMSELKFYQDGLCEYPVPGLGELDQFRAAQVKPLWTYYCCGPETETTNRFIHFPGARTRILGMQLYVYDCAGFLHWGYNFWNSRLSRRVINPFVSTDAGGEFPGGDPFLVYPGEAGPLDSIRHEILREAFQDHRALKLLESLTSREAVLDLLRQSCGQELTVKQYPQSTDAVENLRHAVNFAIERALAKRN